MDLQISSLIHIICVQDKSTKQRTDALMILCWCRTMLSHLILLQLKFHKQLYIDYISNIFFFSLPEKCLKIFNFCSIHNIFSAILVGFEPLAVSIDEHMGDQFLGRKKKKNSDSMNQHKFGILHEFDTFTRVSCLGFWSSRPGILKFVILAKYGMHCYWSQFLTKQGPAELLHSNNNTPLLKARNAYKLLFISLNLLLVNLLTKQATMYTTKISGN